MKPIKTQKEYETALKEIERLFDVEPGTAEGDRLEILTSLVEAYENQHYPIPLPDPVEAIRYYMESRGLNRKDLEPYIGKSSVISDILERRTPLSLEMIRRLCTGLGIPANVLIQSYECEEAA
jgi:HTH-type transcriptional regulator / antitoxin HigA